MPARQPVLVQRRRFASPCELPGKQNLEIASVAA
jgi:hypothetical protein